MTIASFSPATSLFIGTLLLPVVLLTNVITPCQAIALIESSCYMKLTFPTNHNNDIITVEDVAIIESSMTSYFDQLFILIATTTAPNDNSNNSPRYTIPLKDSDDTTVAAHHRIVRQPLQFRVNVADSILIGNMATITAHVFFLYETSSSSIMVSSQQLVETFTLVDLQKDDDTTTAVAMSTFSAFTSDPSFVAIVYSTNENENHTSSIVLIDDYSDSDGNNYSSREVALIVVTVFLSIVLLIVSSVLLHITGGWNVCTTAMSNCLFEEIDDDDDNEYYHKKAEPQTHPEYLHTQPTRTFPLQHSQDQGEEQEIPGTKTTNVPHDNDDEEDTNFLDVESVMTSVLPTSASGLLGVTRNKDVAIHTMMDNDDDDESNIYGDGMTPVSQSQMANNNAPLGITSMRKLQPLSVNDRQNNQGGGFSSGIRMLHHRLLRSASKKDMTPS